MGIFLFFHITVLNILIIDFIARIITSDSDMKVYSFIGHLLTFIIVILVGKKCPKAIKIIGFITSSTLIYFFRYIYY